MRIDVLCVCRRPPRWVADGVAEYAARLPRELELKFHHLAPAVDSLPVAARRREEGARLVARLKPDQALVALDVGGSAVDSETLAGWLDDWRQQHTRLALAIGGADGFDEAVRARAQRRWSLSPLTLPHLLVQVVVAEQLYRAWTILAGHPYHRA